MSSYRDEAEQRGLTILELVLERLERLEQQTASLRTDLGLARLTPNPGPDTDPTGAGRAVRELNARTLERDREVAPYAPVAPSGPEAIA